MRTLLLILALCVPPSSGFSQSADSILRVAHARSWGISAGSNAVVLAEGTVLGFKADTVIFRSARLSISAITEIDRRTRSGGGAWSGAAFGGLVVAGLFGTLAAGFCERECGDDFVLAAAFGIATGGTIRAFIGEVLSPAKRGWQRIWQRPDRP